MLHRLTCSFRFGRWSQAIFLGPLMLALVPVAWGAVSLPPLISDHAVLRASAATHVWGKAAPGENVSVAIGGKTAEARADARGRWQVALDLRATGAGPFELVVKGTNEIKVADVLIGEVWFASGQSNMDFSLVNALGASEEIARPPNPQLRFFKIALSARAEPVEDVKGSWVVVGPATAGNLSAVAYFFAREVQTAIGSPLGVVQSSFGGSSIEAWTSPAALDTVPALKADRERNWKLVADARAQREVFNREFPVWLKTYSREDRSPAADVADFAAPGLDTAGWVGVRAAGPLTGTGLPATGAIWLRHEINIPVRAAGKKTTLRIGALDGLDRIYWNGKLVREKRFADYSGPDRILLDIPGDQVLANRNVLAIRVYSPLSVPAFSGDATTLNGEKLVEGWLAKPEYALPDPASLPPAPAFPPTAPNGQNTPGYLFNSMVHPFLPVTLSGVVWYQGEQNTERAALYRTEFPLLIRDWRTQFGQADLPFYFCQLANFMSKRAEPGEHDWAELREAQAVALSLPNTGQAVTIDVGESGDIHFLDKRPVGHRLANLALVHTYGKKEVVPSGPISAGQTIEGNTVRVRFTEVAAGLVAQPLSATYEISRLRSETAPLVRNRPGSELEGFQICGPDHKWTWADARIDGPTVVVSSPQVREPVAVRYAWAANPTANLANSAGLPAAPFRTDSFPTKSP